MSKVTVYTTPTCVFCHALMSWLDDKDIEYSEVDISDPVENAKLEEKVGHAVRGVPLTLIGNSKDFVEIEGFDRHGIKKALKKLEK